MNARLTALLTLLWMACGNPQAASAGNAQAARPANVVLILADDLGFHDVGFNGRAEWATPNLDRLASEGVQLRRLYAASPVCAPSRAALFTGRSPIHNGVDANEADLPTAEVTLAEALKARGYRTALFGKWHHGKPVAPQTDYTHPIDQGFDAFFGFTDATHAWEKFPTTLWNGRDRVASTGYADELFTDHAVEFLKGQAGDSPFFLVLALTAPHFAIEAPEPDIARYRGKLPEADAAHPHNATYAAMVSRLDAQVGRVLAALHDRDLDQNTLVLFASDNGATFEPLNMGASRALDSNAPFRGQKRTLWEGGIHVPGIARWTGHLPAGAVSTVPQQLVDFFPTVLAAAGAKPEASWRVDGIDQLPTWRDAAGVNTAGSRVLTFEWRSEGAHQVAAIQGRWKLIQVGQEKPELYDVEADPAERLDLASEQPDVVETLQEALENWLSTERPDAQPKAAAPASP